jgi:hypothetical protein
MIAKDLKPTQWFKMRGDYRVWKRLDGPAEIVEGVEAVPVKPLQPTDMMPGCYIPIKEEVFPYKEKFLRLS